MSRISAVNSSIQPLAASGTFTGVAELTLGYSSIIVTCKTDADGDLYIDFSPDGTNWDRTVPYVVQNAQAELHRVTAIMAYYRVRYVNGSSAQSYFRLQTLMNDYVEPSTALNAQSVQPDSGATLTRSAILTQPFLQNVRGTISAQLMTAEQRLLAGRSLDGTTLDTNYFSTTVANNGSIVLSGGSARVRTSSTADGSALLNSKRTARFITGRANICSVTAALSHSGTANNVTEWGVGTADNRIVFRLSGTTLSCVVRSAGVDTVDVASASWNSNRSTPTLTSMNFYEIHYNALFVYFLINGVVMHVVSRLGAASTTAIVEDLTMPIRVSNVNSSGSTSDVSIYVTALAVLGTSGTEPVPIYKNITSATTTLCAVGAGALKRIILNTAANGTVKLYDGITAVNIFASITVSSSDIPTVWEFGTQFNTGLTIVTSASTDITVVYEYIRLF